MKFGLTVSSDDPASFEPRRRLLDHVRRAELARDVGFDLIAVNNRYSYGPASADERGEPLVTSRFMPLPLVAHLAGHFGDSIDYSALVVSPSLNPVQLAEDVSTIDAMTGGRFTLVTTLGWMPYEFEAFGVEHSTRGRRFEELLTAYKALLTQDVVDFDGEFFQYRDAKLVARTVQKPHPPLWVGASADAAIRRAARLGDTWTMSSHAELDELERQQEVFATERANVGREMPTDRPISRIIYIAEDREAALEEARPTLANWYRKRGEWGWFVTEDKEQSLDDAALQSGRWLIGNPDDVIEQVETLQRRLGITQINVSMAWPADKEEQRLRTIELLGERVLPHFKTS